MRVLRELRPKDPLQQFIISIHTSKNHSFNYRSMSKIIKLRKGLDINLQGKASESLAEVPLAKQYAVSPLDFEGLTPKLLVKVGDKVLTSAVLPLFEMGRTAYINDTSIR